MMVMYAGLNPMGGKAKAGCPIKNIQPTLDGLTGAGLTVAVYEEANDLDSSPGKKIKKRILAQIVSPGSSTYLYDACLRTDDVDFKENRPWVALMKNAGGYALGEIYLDSKVMKVTERMTEEAVRAALQATGVVEPLYFQGMDNKDTLFIRSFLPDIDMKEVTGHTPQNFHKVSHFLPW